MHLISQIKKNMARRMVGRIAACFIMAGALITMPLGLRSASASAAGTPMTCYSTAGSLGQIVDHVTLCWNSTTGEFEIYTSPVSSAVLSGSCGTGGSIPVSCTGGTAYRPSGLLTEIHIIPDNLTPPPGTTISITILFQFHKKPTPLTPLEYQTTFNFDSLTVMNLPSHCTQLFP
jgi:hypothetical protein